MDNAQTVRQEKTEMFRKCERILKGQHNHCAACGEYFNSNIAFEKHRIGEFGVDRRCASVEEMTVKGMSLNAGGWWVTQKMTQELISNKGGEGNQALSGEMGISGSTGQIVA